MVTEEDDGPVWVPLLSDQVRRERRSMIFATVFAGVFVVLPGIGFVAAVVAFVDQPELFRFGVVVFCVVFGAVFYVFARTGWSFAQAVPPVADSAMLGIAADELTIVHPEVFRQVVTLPARLVRAVAIDATGRRRDTFSWSRFAVHVDGEPAGFLWSHRRESTLPVIGVAREVPSVVVIFHEPVGFENVWGVGSLFDRIASGLASGGQRGGALPLEPGRRYDGILLPVGNVEAARSALRTWPQFRGRLERDDVPARVTILPPPARPAAWAFSALEIYLAFVGVALLAGVLGWYRGPLYVPLVLPLFVVAAVATIASARPNPRRIEGVSSRRRVIVTVGVFVVAGVSLVLLIVDFFEAAGPTRREPTHPLPPLTVPSVPPFPSPPSVPSLPSVPALTTITAPGTTPNSVPPAPGG